MDLKDSLKLLMSSAVKAETPKVIEAPKSEPDDVYFLWDGTSLTRAVAEPRPRLHTAMSIESLVRVLADEASAPEIWQGRAMIVGIFDKHSRRNVVRMHLPVSEPMQCLMGLAAVADSRLKQKPLLDMLRITLAGTLGNEPDLVSRVRNIKWRTSDSGEATVGQGKSSIGKTLLAEVMNLTDLKDEIKLSVPVYRGYPWRADILCTFDVEPADQTFRIRPVAGAIEDAFREAERLVWDALVTACAACDLKAPVYYGDV